ncbi:MAG TPA: dienelactone hydrolase family protein [Actinomycetales bacterium]|nr:dienelactone hydrolase family protein [Actinomycetales bacterium]
MANTTGETIDLSTPRGTMHAVVARPGAAGEDDATAGRGGPWPGVVVIHDAVGMSEDLRRQTEWLAGSGFITIAPDLLYWGGTVKCLRAIMRDVSAGAGPSYDDVDTARTWLVAQPDCTGRVGVIGFCMGGGFALALAPGHGFSASSVNYGTAGRRTMTPAALEGACPIIGSYGTRDVFTRRGAKRLDAALTDLGVEHEITFYPGAGHSFLNDHRDPVSRAMRLLSIGYHEPSARLARPRIVAFLERHLREVA